MTTPIPTNLGNGFSNHAAGLLGPREHNTRPASAVSSASQTRVEGRSSSDKESPARAKSISISSQAQTIDSSKHPQSAAKPGMRTIPPWIHAVDEDDARATSSSRLLPPGRARPASHHYMPAPRADASAGKHFDYARERTPALQSMSARDQAYQWHNFIQASAWGRPESERGEIVSEQWMQNNLPDLDRPWEPQGLNEDEKNPKLWQKGGWKRWKQRHYRTIMRNAMIPLIVRVTVLIFSVLALALAGSIFHLADRAGCSRGPSTYLAIIIDCVAIVYTLYITFDEYTSKPIGLRSASAKLRLLFLDMIFIVFDSANLSLAFESLRDTRWACWSVPQFEANLSTCPQDRSLCVRQKALTATLLIALIAWLVTFSISVLRIVERVVGR